MSERLIHIYDFRTKGCCQCCAGLLAVFCLDLSLSLHTFCSVKLQYISSSLFYSWIVVSFSYFPPPLKYISSFYLQNVTVEGGSLLGFGSYFFFQSGCFGCFEGYREELGTTSTFEMVAFSALEFIIILMISSLSDTSK